MNYSELLLLPQFYGNRNEAFRAIKFPESFIREHIGGISWDVIWDEQKVSENFIRDFQSHANWDLISSRQKLSEDFILEFKDKVNWNKIFNCQTVSEDFIRKYIYMYCPDHDSISDDVKISLENVSYRQILSEDFIREFQNILDFGGISHAQCLSEDFIEEFEDRVEWYSISRRQKLSESFIRKYQDKVYWEQISIYQILSEDFIYEFQDKVDWKCIQISQTLSENFIGEFQDYLDFSAIICTQKLSKEFFNEYEIEKVYSKELIDNWLYLDENDKKFRLMDTLLFDTYNEYFIAYKVVRSDGYSGQTFNYKYESGNVYTTTAIHSVVFGDTYFTDAGFFVTTKLTAYKLAQSIPHSKVIEVKVYYKDLARVLYAGRGNYEVTCTKMYVL